VQALKRLAVVGIRTRGRDAADAHERRFFELEDRPRCMVAAPHQLAWRPVVGIDRTSGAARREGQACRNSLQDSVGAWRVWTVQSLQRPARPASGLSSVWC